MFTQFIVEISPYINEYLRKQFWQGVKTMTMTKADNAEHGQSVRNDVDKEDAFRLAILPFCALKKRWSVLRKFS